MILRKLSLYRYSIELDKLLPVGNQRIAQRDGLVLHVETETDAQQVEIAPLSGHDIDGHPITGFSHETVDEVSQTLTQLLPNLENTQLDKLLEITDSSEQPSLAFALNLLHAKFSGTLRAPRTEPQIIPLIYRNQDEDLATLQQRIAQLSLNIHTVKVKVGQTSMEDEIQLIHHILSVRPDLKLRLDANRAFELPQAIDFCACLPLEAIDYIEEPCRNNEDNPKLYQAIGIRFALDETLNSPSYQFSMLSGLAALVIKPMLLGSLTRLQTLIDVANSFGVKTVISSSLEASLGIADLKAISAECTPDSIPGLDTLNAFSCDLLVSSGKSRCLTLDDLTLIKQVG